MRITTETHKSGYFWLPGEEKKKVPGTMSILAGGKVELKTVGHFDESDHAFNNPKASHPRVVGLVEGDGFVTLDGCIYEGRVHSFGGIDTARFHVNFTYLGIGYDHGDEVAFDRMTFTFDCLGEWVGAARIRLKIDQPGGDTVITVQQTYRDSYVLADGFTLDVVVYPYINSRNGAIEVKERAVFDLRTQSPQPLKTFREMYTKLQSLMALAMDQSVTLSDLTAFSKENVIHIDEEKTTPAEIKILYRSIPYIDIVPRPKKGNFSYQEVRERFADIVNGWVAAHETIAPAFNLYFSAKSGAHRAAEPKFLALVQALETFHRRTNAELNMNPAAFSELVAGLMDTCPKEHRQWLSGRLMNGNELPLKKRLLQLAEPYSATFPLYLEQVKKIGDTRNYLTHYDPDNKHKAATGSSLMQLCTMMESLLVLLFLHLIEVQPDRK